jgi:molybdenum cofactor cytidylyltransferase
VNVHALILAAGASTRMGSPKQLLDWNGKSLIRHCIETAQEAGLSPITVVLGSHFHEIARETEPLQVQLVHNEHWEVGMGSSISVGVGEILEKFPETQAILMMLCDQPKVSARTLHELVQKLSQSNLVASEYDGTFGVPAVIGRDFFQDLLALMPSSGAKAIFKKYSSQLVTVPVPEAALDLDTPEQYQQLIQKN